MKTTTLFSSFFVAFFVLITACNSEKKESPQDVSPIPKEVSKPSEEVVFVLDVSASMLAQDFVPNRLEAVKTMLKKMIKERAVQQRMSIILFAGEGFILCPLTKDSIKLMESVDLIQADRMEEGTAIGLGIMLGLYELSKSKSAQKDIILLTDGVNNVDEYAPSFAAQIATQQNIQIHSFGLGCHGTALSPIAKRPDNTFVFGETSVKIDEEILKTVGEQTQGNYLRVTCSSDLENLQHLNSLMDHSNSIPISNKLDTFPAEALDSFWNALYLKDKISLKNFNTLE